MGRNVDIPSRTGHGTYACQTTKTPAQAKGNSYASPTITIKSSGRFLHSPAEGTPTGSRSSCFSALAHRESPAAHRHKAPHRMGHAAGRLRRSASRRCSIVLLALHQAQAARPKRPICLRLNRPTRHLKDLDGYPVSCSSLQALRPMLRESQTRLC